MDMDTTHTSPSALIEKAGDTPNTAQTSPETITADPLTPLQHHVTRCGGTEPPFDNAYWDHKAPGIYVDIVSAEPLFASSDKFDSGTGWPSFTRTLVAENITEHTDHSHGMTRTEVRAAQSGNHLGHVFPDGPAPDGRRYCINSAALRFVPQEDLEAEGYGAYATLFAAEA